MREIRICVTGGGSSGHISPALAIIQTLREMAQQPPSTCIGDDLLEGLGPWAPNLLYIGGQRGLEKEQVEAQGVPFVGVETGKLRRYLSRENFTDALRVPVGVWQAFGHVRRFRPHVILATGGYVAVPPVMAGAALRVPVITHEQTVQIGLANRINAVFASRIALSFPAAAEELPLKLRSKAFVAGNPVRASIFGGDARRALEWCGFAKEELPTLYVTGGSQGARILNRGVEEVLPRLLEACRVIHQCGRQPGDEQDFDRLSRAASLLEPRLQRRYFVAPFIRDELRDVFALADLVAGRAGAGTVTELCALGKPAIFVPLVPTGGDEQTRNARMMEEAGAARSIKQAEFSGERLLEQVQVLAGDKTLLQKMGEGAKTLARPDAARDMARAVLELAMKNPRA
jgi:UDP-N-acetylglucosamine--N-acetylmuramyl-(pentapeptide) pyrophosphoryl-undecaprenol N-acetylglucosamine transferase